MQAPIVRNVPPEGEERVDEDREAPHAEQSVRRHPSVG